MSDARNTEKPAGSGHLLEAGDVGPVIFFARDAKSAAPATGQFRAGG
jgi:hypothetical protein